MRRRSIEAPNGPRLLFVDTGSGTGLELRLGTQLVAQCLLPVSALVAEDGRREWRRSGYSECSAGANGMSARGELRASGSRIVFRDRYSIQADQIKVTRNVDVEGDSPGCGFLSALEWDLDRASLDDPWFAPGVWHGTNDNVPTYAIGAPETRLMRDTVVFREDRLTLPFLLHYDTARRIVFSFSRLEADGQTVEADDDDEPCIDGELRFGSFGMIRHGTGVAFWYPGTEGEISYPPLWTLGRGNDQTDSSVNPFQRKNATAGSRSWSYRFHPLHDRFHHGFSLRLDCRHAPQFFAACDAHWRSLSAAYRPRVLAADLDRVERTSVDLLASMTTRVGEVSGIPTWIDCFTGTPGKLQNTFGIGFVSRNAEAALLLLDYGHRWGDAAMIARGGEILDFWTMRSGYGLSHTEYDPYAGAWVDASDGGSPCVYLRDQSESRRSCLQAWQIEETRGVSHPLWLQWAKSYGDWLLSHQELAGGFKRAYRLDGTAISTNPSDCSH
ncbi:MAG TPA: hypothetical protein VL354_14495, partial [Spirochaetia bacterium]|nr:hypothetical protein [Spirochaetia bacterium]